METAEPWQTAALQRLQAAAGGASAGTRPEAVPPHGRHHRSAHAVYQPSAGPMPPTGTALGQPRLVARRYLAPGVVATTSA